MHDRAGLIPFETARLRVAALIPNDAAALAVITDDPAIVRRVHFLETPFDEAKARALIESEPGFNGMRLRDGGMLVGMLGLHPRGAEYEIGYWVGGAYRGLGYAREAVTAALARLGGIPVHAECAPANAISWRFLLSLGFCPTDEAGKRPGRQVLRRN